MPLVSRSIGVCLCTMMICAGQSRGQTTRAYKPDDFFAVVRRYADVMLERGRDDYGPARTRLFLSALDREGPRPLTTLPAPPEGARPTDRVGSEKGPLAGANPHHDENLLRILYALTAITGDRKYEQAADDSLRWFLSNAAWKQTGLLPWGEHMSWDVISDRPAWRYARHEFFRPWVIWNRCFSLDRKASSDFARSLWEHQIADHDTGAFDRHAIATRHGPGTEHDFPRHAGFYIGTWAAAYRHTKDDVFIRAIDVLLTRFEKKRHPVTGLIHAWSTQKLAWPASDLSLAVDGASAAAEVPEPLASRLRRFAVRTDEAFLSLPHRPDGEGFVIACDRETARVGWPDGSHGRSVRWEFGYGGGGSAAMALLCLARYGQTPDTRYRELILATADGYRGTLPDPAADIWPAAPGHAISVQLAAYRLSGKAACLDDARRIATWAVSTFWGDNPLPRASVRSEHYESMTGADTLALALLELATVDTPAATQVPANTIDR